jgi:hypothetical protein
MKNISIIALLVLLVLSMMMLHPSGSTPEAKDKSLDAYVVAEESVISILKSPATANFPAYLHASITEKDNNYWQISSVVHSQNSVGAMLRSNRTVELIFVGEILINTKAGKFQM